MTLSAEDLTAIRRQLVDGQTLVRETVDRLRQSQEENEMMARRRDELESRVAALETEYEELLGSFLSRPKKAAMNDFVLAPIQRRPSTTKRQAMST